MMKVTLNIPDKLMTEVLRYSGGNNLTESLTMALEEWLYIKRINELIEKIKDNPIDFVEGYSADGVRRLNNRIT